MNVAYCLVGEIIINQKNTQIGIELQLWKVVRHPGHRERVLTCPRGRQSGGLVLTSMLTLLFLLLPPGGRREIPRDRSSCRTP